MGGNYEGLDLYLVQIQMFPKLQYRAFGVLDLSEYNKLVLMITGGYLIFKEKRFITNGWVSNSIMYALHWSANKGIKSF